MIITFCLPRHTYKRPIGGFKIVFEYANRLAERGYKVNIAFNCENLLSEYKIPYVIRRIICKFVVDISPKWFALNHSIKKIAVDGITDKTIPCSDVIIATGVKTANPVAYLSENKGRKYYLIQDFENWNVDDNFVYKTYSLGMRNITISYWLEKKVRTQTENVVCIPNPIDCSAFYLCKEYKNRKPHSIGVLYHEAEHKGFQYAWDTITRLKLIFPDLTVEMFGGPLKPDFLPEWVNYTQNATQIQLLEIYNNIKVFLCMSIIEGFGLTGAEAMACGSVLVSSNYQGVFEYAEDGKNALLVSVKDVDSAVEKVKYVFENVDLAKEISDNAVESIKYRSWENAIDAMTKELALK